MKYTRLDCEVSVTAVLFRGNSLDTMPRRIEYDGKSHEFIDGMRLSIRSGDQITRVYEMTDGNALYQLRHDDSGWRLLAVR